MTKKLFNYIIISVELYVKEEDVIYAAGAEWTISKATAANPEEFEEVALLQTAHFMKLNGTNVVLNKLTYYPRGTITKEVIWEGSEDITDWTQDVSLGVAITLTADTADLVANAKKLFVKGINVTVTKVTYTA